jgi:hypothetical protein
MKACRILFAAALVVFILGTGPGTIQRAASRAATGRTVNERDAIQNDSDAADGREGFVKFSVTACCLLHALRRSCGTVFDN